jgi:hypothetical protein
MTNKTLEELAKAAAAAEGTLKLGPPLAQATVKRARAAIRELEARWDLPPQQKATGKNRIKNEARDELAKLDQERKLALGPIKRYAEVAGNLPSAGTMQQELRRSRLYTALEKAVESSPIATHQAARFRELVNAAEQNADLPTLEAARELSRALELRGLDIDPGITSHLDRLAGPPATRDAIAMHDRATDGARYAGIGIGYARQTLEEPANTECGLMGANYDGTPYVIDDWAPAPEHTSTRGDRVTIE